MATRILTARLFGALERSKVSVILACLLICPSLVHAQSDVPTINPATLEVPEPGDISPRRPDTEITRLLRAELSILEALENLEIDIARRDTEIDRLRNQQDIVERDLAETNSRFDAMTETLNGERARVRTRLRAMVQLRRTEPYQVLFSSQSYATFLRRERAVGALLEADKALIAQYRKTLAKWEQLRTGLERRRTNLANTQSAIANVIQELNWDREEKRLLLEAVTKRRAFHAKVGREMEAVDRALRDHVQQLYDAQRNRLWFEENKGQLALPIYKGDIIGRYGIRTHSSFGTRTVHRGIDITQRGWDGKSNVSVKSIYWGWVAYSGWVTGLGRTVIIDHTRGYMTLYGHLDRVDVKEGEKVKTGQRIGLMGDTGSLEGARLYLEIRKDGRAINPLPWFR
jgi:septal ring factor EnvC (AmiA/AmiB activator)